MLGAPPLGLAPIAAVALCVLLASESAPATLKSKLSGTSEVMWSKMKWVGESTFETANSWIAAISAGRPAMDEAMVAIFPSMVLDSLPQWFRTAPPVLGPDTSDDVKHQWDLARKARVADYTFQPFIDERRVKIVAPDGFKLRALPPDKTTQLGPAMLTESYSEDKAGVVTGYHVPRQHVS